MIITRTPFRVTLGGGGTDLPSYYEKHGGLIFAMGIDKYMYVMTNPPIVDRKIRLHYTQSEIVDHVSQLKHELAREALRFHGIDAGMEISSMADLPAGAGVGSSSAYLVGLLTALHHYCRVPIPPQALAEEACHIELNVLKKRIGKQDQYMAAFGGLTVLEIDPDGTVAARTVLLRTDSVAKFINQTHMYYTGLLRNAPEVLRDQDNAMRLGEDSRQVVEDSLNRIKDLGYRILAAIEAEDFELWGKLLDEHWQFKRRMSQKISHSEIDQLYEHVRRNLGVLGGKIVGAGGGGFLMLYCPKNSRELEDFMLSRGMPRLHYSVEHEGAKVVANIGTAGLVPPSSAVRQFLRAASTA